MWRRQADPGKYLPKSFSEELWSFGWFFQRSTKALGGLDCRACLGHEGASYMLVSGGLWLSRWRAVSMLFLVRGTYEYMTAGGAGGEDIVRLH